MKKCSYCGREYGDDVTVCPDDGATLQVPGAPASRPPAANATGHLHTGLAVTSLILGILSFVLCLGPLLGIPAVICGHIAWSRAKNNPAQYGGRRMSLAGLIIGYANTVIFVLVGVALVLAWPALGTAKKKLEQAACTMKLVQVGIAAHTWADAHNGVFPTNLLDLTNELSGPNLLICPADPHHHRTGSRAIQVWDPDNVTYQLLTPGLAVSNVEKQVVIRCPIHGIEILGDGTVNADKVKP